MFARMASPQHSWQGPLLLVFILFLIPKVCLPSKSWGPLVSSRVCTQQETGQARRSGCSPSCLDRGEREGRAVGFRRGNPSNRGQSQKNYATPFQVPRCTSKDTSSHWQHLPRPDSYAEPQMLQRSDQQFPALPARPQDPGCYYYEERS